ncbi:hypothetical protein TRVL_09801 [Trypanosoma vivax]|nr:hypothetical protein TRVL_09801 [Trypanosoma vivax]
MYTRNSQVYRQNAPGAPTQHKQSAQCAQVTSLLALARARIAMQKTELIARSKEATRGGETKQKDRKNGRDAGQAGESTLLENLNETAWEVLARVTSKREQGKKEGICKCTQLNEIVEQVANSHAAHAEANETKDAMRRIFTVLVRNLRQKKNTLKHAFEERKLAMRALLSAREFANQGACLPLHGQLLDILAGGSEVTENDKQTPRPDQV